jgi:hypothetical protein
MRIQLNTDIMMKVIKTGFKIEFLEFNNLPVILLLPHGHLLLYHRLMHSGNYRAYVLLTFVLKDTEYFP